MSTGRTKQPGLRAVRHLRFGRIGVLPLGWGSGAVWTAGFAVSLLMCALLGNPLLAQSLPPPTNRVTDAGPASFKETEARITKLIEEARTHDALIEAEASVARSQRDGNASMALAVALGLRGLCFTEQSKNERAKEDFQRALSVLRSMDTTDAIVNQAIARNLVNIGVIDQLEGAVESSEKSLNAALEIQERVLPADHIDIATTLIGLAKVSQLRRDLSNEQLLWTRALDLRRRGYVPRHYNIAVALEGLAGALEAQSKVKDAEPLLREALDYRLHSHQPGHPHIASIHQRLANNLRRQGKDRLAEAEKLHLAGLDIRERSNAFPGDRARHMIDLAQLYLEMRRFADAHHLLVDAVGRLEKLVNPNHDWLAHAHSQLALAESLLNNDTGALENARATSRIIATRPSQNSALTRFHFENHVRYGWRARTNPADKQTEVSSETFVIAQRASITMAAASAARMTARLTARTPELQSHVREQQDLSAALSTAERELNGDLASSAPMAEVDRIRGTIRDIEGRLRSLEDRLRSDFPQFESLVRPLPMTLADAQKRLGADEVLLFAYTGFDDVYVWAVTQEGHTWLKPALKVAELNQIVAKLRDGLIFGPADADPQGALANRPLYDLGLAHRLYQLLFGKAEALIAGKKHILYVPTGSLATLPLHVLLRTKPAIAQPTRKQPGAYREAPWVIRSHEISVLPEVANLNALRAVTSSDAQLNRKPLVAFADPIYGGAENPAVIAASGQAVRGAGRGTRRNFPSLGKSGALSGFEALKLFDRLAGTRDEVTAVATIVGADAADILLDRSATEANVKRLDREGRLSQYRIVYFATHGIVADAPIDNLKIGNREPALVMTLPTQPSTDDDGLLTASEIATLKIDADWVVLSACDTAAGQTTGGEALSGLARAFFYAGARSLVVTHWGASDLDAKEIMTRTFSEMRASPGTRKSEAVRRAMMSRIDKAGASWDAYPSYWGPFTFIVAAQ